jgi:exodeoxyribonuclease-3
MKLISFNVNGIRAITGKLKNGSKSVDGTNVLTALIQEQNPDVLCFQEIKTQSSNDLAWLKTHFPHIYTSVAKKKGYSGVALLSKTEPEWISEGFDEYDEEWIGAYKEKGFHQEGRILTAKFSSCIVVTVYTPNSQDELARLSERLEWEQVLRMYLLQLEQDYQCPVLLCGDLNCAHTELDLKNPKSNRKSAGFSVEECREFQKTLDAGFIDSFRFKHPDTIKYSYFSYLANARARNTGWRIDYVLTSVSLKNQIAEAEILNEYHGSDHCPVMIRLEPSL